MRDALASLSGRGFSDLTPPLRVVLVVEGQARGITSLPTVDVVSASGSGDDAIVELVATEHDSETWVVTADRELRDRVQSLGARALGPGTLRAERDA